MLAHDSVGIRFEFEHQKKLKEMVETFSEGNTVDVKIQYADGTSEDARPLPCTVFKSKTVDDVVVDRVYSLPGIIKNCLRNETPIDLSYNVT